MRVLVSSCVAAAALLGWSAHAAAAVRSAFSLPPNAPPGAQGTLRVESDAGDSILVVCVGNRVLVNGGHPDTGPLSCSLVTRIDVQGGPGDNRIDLGGISPTQVNGVFKGVAAYASLDGGAGDDVLIGPSGGLVKIEGGAGSDHLQGGAYDTYVFRGALAPERDTIVERSDARCSPSYYETDNQGLSYWTVPWDALDFRGLAADDPVRIDQPASDGILAMHRNRTVTVAGTELGTRFEAIAGGAGNDRIGRACMVLGEAGSDILSGGPDGDLLVGGAGDDQLFGSDGPDELYGGIGADMLDGGKEADALEGGPGVDVLSFDLGLDVPVVVDLSRGLLARTGELTVRAEPGASRFIEGVIGGKGNDRMTGNAARNHFWSGGGVDLAAGGRGDDVFHADWSGSMPAAAYDWDETWSGPFDRGAYGGRSYWVVRETRRSVLRILEGLRGGFDTVDLSTHLEGQLAGIRADLSADLWVANHPRVGVLTARRGGARYLEAIRGTSGPDVLVGNGADNLLDGEDGSDRLVGRQGSDTCVGERKVDRLRSCERVRRPPKN